jgi:hypothetical protein
MSIFRQIVSIGTFFLFGWESAATTFAASNFNCDTVINQGLRQYHITSSDTSYLHSIFSKYCYADGRSNSSSLNIGIEAVIKAIPVKFSLGSTDQTEAMSNFCKTYAESEDFKSKSSNYEETIVNRAYESFDSCVRLSALGLSVTHDIITDEKAQILLRAGVGKPIEINGLDSSENISCSGSDGLGKELAYTKSTHRQSAETIGIFCTRKSRNGEGGISVFDEGSVAIDITGDKYNFYWPKSEVLPETLASQVQVSINELRASIAAQGSLISGIGRGRILAMIQVQKGEIISKSSGTTFDPATGRVSFPNAKNWPFIGLVSDAKNAMYITSTSYIIDGGKDYFQVWNSNLDTGSENRVPRDFTAAAIAFDTSN